MKQEFDPQKWLDKAKAEAQATKNTNPSVHSATADKQSINLSADLSAEVDKVVTRIEAAFEDITTSYADWVNVGFAFAHEFGECGRKFYHRVSRFYMGYTKVDTDKQYDRCLKSNGHGITINTFFYMAKQVGIEVKGHGARSREHGVDCMEQSNDQYSVGNSADPSIHQSISPSIHQSFSPSVAPELPTLPDALFDHLPQFFKKVVVMADSKEERDMLLLGALGTISSCLSKFSGYYGNRKVHPNLYVYITAPASAGKGNMVMCRHLVDLIDEERSNQSYLENLVFDHLMREYNIVKNRDLDAEKPVKPPIRMLFIPANNSTTGFYQLLADNDGSGLLFETEGDTLALAFKTDYGNFSDGIRKAFHHEMISYFRRTERENVRIRFPQLSIVISSTIGQLSGLIPSVENGLASRFMFYHMNIRPVWHDVLAREAGHSWDDHFSSLGKEFYSLYSSLKTAPDIDFKLSPKQHQQFNDVFTQMQDKYLSLNGEDSIAMVRRLGLIAFRIMMVLTAIRIPETGDFSVHQECSDEDFQSTLSIVDVLARHSSYVLSQLPAVVKTVRGQNNKEKFFEGLGVKFTRKDFVALAKSLDINERTAERYVAAFCENGLVVKEDYSSYTKKTVETGNYTEPG